MTLSRLVAAPGLVAAGVLGYTNLFAGLLAFGFATDVIDGKIARAMGQMTERGARLDSVADAALCLAALVGAVWLFPWLWRDELITILPLLGVWVAALAFGLWKFGTLTSYHTSLARVACVPFCVGIFVMIFTQDARVFRVSSVLVFLALIEEIVITALLSSPRSNVPSMWHARAARPPAELIAARLPTLSD